MKKTILSLMMAAFLFSSQFCLAQAKEKEGKTLELTRKTEDNEEVAKLKEASNKQGNAKADDAVKKKGPVYGPDYCDVVVDNYTNLWIKIWIDGNYKGVVEPYGKKTVYAVPGRTKMYCRADYDNGDYDYWGPDYFNCDYQYTIRLR